MGVCEKKFRLEVPNDLAAIPLIRDFVGNTAKIAGFNERVRVNIELAVEEAARNVILHAFAPGEEGSFNIICEPTSLGIKVIVREMGMPFDLSRVPECDRNGPDEDRTGRTPGICRMKQTMDEVSFHNLGKGGKETHLVKYLDDRAIGSCMTAAELEEAEKTKGAEALPKGSVSFQVRRMELAEAVEVSKCAYAAYHYSYLEYVYYPERIRRLNETGELTSYVAVAPDGEIMGHAAIKGGKEPGVAELSTAFVKPKYRGQGCLNALSEVLIREAKRRGLAGLYVRAITSHPYSQKTALKYGFGECCLFLAVLDPPEFAEIHTGKRERESLVHSFLYLNRPGTFSIYAPPHHTEMILRIYEGLGVHPQAVRDQQDLPYEDSSVRITADPNHTANIEVLQCGRNVVSEVKRHLRDLCISRIEAVYLFLNLCDPLTALMTAEFEKMGFFFAGINPGPSGTDRLVLQFLNNLAVDYSHLQFASNKGQQIAEYVRLHDPYNAEY
ncbi:MAG: GNAT family N-acetyltransferase [Nitrospirae bacterium]|nr:GNAT family N-acetyltransferase [Nitrospirota bacterium]